MFLGEYEYKTNSGVKIMINGSKLLLFPRPLQFCSLITFAWLSWFGGFKHIYEVEKYRKRICSYARNKLEKRVAMIKKIIIYLIIIYLCIFIENKAS